MIHRIKLMFPILLFKNAICYLLTLIHGPVILLWDRLLLILLHFSWLYTFRVCGYIATVLKRKKKSTNMIETDFFCWISSCSSKLLDIFFIIFFFNILLSIFIIIHSANILRVCSYVRTNHVKVGKTGRGRYSANVRRNFNIIWFLMTFLCPAAHLRYSWLKQY